MSWLCQPSSHVGWRSYTGFTSPLAWVRSRDKDKDLPSRGREGRFTIWRGYAYGSGALIFSDTAYVLVQHVLKVVVFRFNCIAGGVVPQIVVVPSWTSRSVNP